VLLVSITRRLVRSHEFVVKPIITKVVRDEGQVVLVYAPDVLEEARNRRIVEELIFDVFFQMWLDVVEYRISSSCRRL
jgi:hypothetical protein